MQSSISTVSPLRQCMVEDMRMRTLAAKTQTAYIQAVRKFAKFQKHIAHDCSQRRDLMPKLDFEVKTSLQHLS